MLEGLDKGVHRDINDIQQVIHSKKITADNADYHIYEYERFTNESIIAKNITAARELQLQVKGSVSDKIQDLELTYREYIKHFPTPKVFTINNDRGNPTPLGETVPNFFINYKNKLNIYKFFIDNRNPDKWRAITLQTNMPLYIKDYLREQTHNNHISRAYVKLYELIAIFKDVLPLKCHSLHICEAPGEFIAATYQYVCSHKGTMSWNANSLNYRSPIAKQKYGYIIGDQFGYIRKYPNNWLFGVDGTGDITNPANIDGIVDKAKTNLQHVNFFTSDCGLDSSDDFEEQECHMAQINLAQVICCLRILEKGGSAIFKMYIPFSEPSNVSLLYLLHCCFNKLNIVKQIAGSPGSSEVYIVCENYLTRYDTAYLMRQLVAFDSKVLLYTIPASFLKFLEDSVRELVKRQLMILKRNFYYYENPQIFEKHAMLMDAYKIKHAQQWYRFVEYVNVKCEL